MNDSLSIPEIARRLNHDPDDIRKLIDRGDIYCTRRVQDRYGWRVSRGAVEQWLIECGRRPEVMR
ncbi:helix-turn-helix domain-containing protein [Planctomycetes bacterium TBK1r]|uniref:Helix-turn-helix domain protein n=1 Tax=Stieleria magnilauensis TaxID=2527963 RepID=A0ABX5XYC9_9BACT|nr:Helix-turn-helix domain protein [Planctomycetes bacterium TBK1r]QDV87052.1 Helix-turn-helix domain protein [Planctomycetes bacterium TBK1r]